MLSVIKKSTMVLSKRLRDVISDKRKHHGFIGEVTGWANVISDKRNSEAAWFSRRGGGMLSVIKESTMVLSKRWRDVISNKRKHHGFIEKVEGCYQ